MSAAFIPPRILDSHDFVSLECNPVIHKSWPSGFKNNVAHTEVLQNMTKVALETKPGELLRVKAELSEVKKKQELTDETMSFLHVIRRECLEERRVCRLGGHPSDRAAAIVKYRNEIAHGGNVLCDMDCIQLLEGEKHPHVSAYKEDFGHFYRIPYEQALKKLPSSQRKIIRTFNIVCSIQERLVWQTPEAKNTRTTVENNANIIIEAFSNTENPIEFASRLEGNGKLAEHYDEMDKEFRILSS